MHRHAETLSDGAALPETQYELDPLARDEPLPDYAGDRGPVRQFLDHGSLGLPGPLRGADVAPAGIFGQRREQPQAVKGHHEGW